MNVFVSEKREQDVDHRASASGSDADLRTAMPGDDSFDEKTAWIVLKCGAQMHLIYRENP
jgi:hypothetical protein